VAADPASVLEFGGDRKSVAGEAAPSVEGRRAIAVSLRLRVCPTPARGRGLDAQCPCLRPQLVMLSFGNDETLAISVALNGR
jgi:hypothetical protein